MDRKALLNVFQCKNCEFTTHYKYFGKQPPFCREIILLEDAYVVKDPFTREGGFMVIGSHCSLCHSEVCCNQKCSIFYSKRFCMQCCLNHLDEFPSEVQQEILKNRKSE